MIIKKKIKQKYLFETIQNIMDTTESRWFKIVVFLLTSIVVGVSIANIVYYNRIRSGTCGAVSNGEATTMLWISVIVLIIAALIWLWSIWRLFFSRETRERVKHVMLDPSAGAGMGYTYAPTAVATSTDEAAMVVGPTEQQSIDQAMIYS